MAPGVDQRRARARALAQEVDVLVAERLARCLQVVDLLREPVAGEVVAVVGESRCAAPKAVLVRAEGRLAEDVRRVLHRRVDLGAVEPDGAVDAAIADEDHVAVGGVAARPRERHVRDARTALEAEHRLLRVRGERADPGHRQRDQARLRIGRVLGDDECAAVGVEPAVVGGVGARLEDEVAGLRPLGDRDTVVAGKAEVCETRHRQPDEDEGDDARGCEGSCRGGFHLVPLLVGSMTRR